MSEPSNFESILCVLGLSLWLTIEIITVEHVKKVKKAFLLLGSFIILR